ncbi:GNAT family N-acetyltransferase [Candidatus Peregrinibacteria bacterium]|nr:GNAT family N-acetyltransferase [Candidatus Peregrinibacteria bacterium]
MISAENALTGSIVCLRGLSEGDATAEYAAWLNDPEVNKYLETRHVTLPELRDYIRDKKESPTAILMGIFWKENGRHIGNVKLEPINKEKKSATMGILIGDKNYWGKGVATETTNLVTEYAFSDLKLELIELGVISENAAAIRVYKKCGFETVRVEPKVMDHDGILYDKVVMRKLAPRMRP